MLSPVSSASCLKLRPSISWAMKTSRCSSGSSSNAASSSSRSTLRAYTAAGPASGDGSIFEPEPTLLVCVERNLDFGPLFAETIDDAIPRHAVEPGANLLDRLHQPIRFYQFKEDILQDVFSVSFVVHALAD